MRKYISAGKADPPHCEDCINLEKDPNSWAYGWCTLHDHASVCITGGCSQHSPAMLDDPDGVLRVIRAALEIP